MKTIEVITKREKLCKFKLPGREKTTKNCKWDKQADIGENTQARTQGENKAALS